MMQPHADDASEGLISKDDLYARASAQRLTLQDDRLDRWRSAGLTAAGTLIPGTNRRGFTPEQAGRVVLVARIASEIKSERPTTSEIAYLLAYEGHDAPADLVLRHIEASIEAFQKRVERWLKAFGNHKLLHVDTVQPLARLIVRALLKRFTPPIAQDLLEDGIMLMLDAMLNDEPAQKTPALVEHVIRRAFPNATAEASQLIWDIVLEFMLLVRLDDKNALLQAVREVNCSERELTIQTVRDSRLLLEIAAKVFPWMLDSKSLLHDERFDEDDSEFVNRRFPPMVCAVLLTARNNPFTRNMLERVRSGDSSTALDDFQKLKQVSDQVAGSVTSGQLLISEPAH